MKVSGLTVEEVQQTIHERASTVLLAPKVRVALAEMGPLEPIEGDYLVGPDGTVALGSYGSVEVVGMTLDGARNAIETYLGSISRLRSSR